MPELVIRFVKTKGIISDIIAEETNSLFDHTEAKSLSGGWIGAHSNSGVQDRPANYLDSVLERDYQYAVEVTQDEYDKTQAFAQSKIGTSYNFADIIGLLIHDREINNSKDLICSQFMTLFLQAAGLVPLNVSSATAYLVTPETLHLSPLFGIHNRIYCLEPDKDLAANEKVVVPIE